MERFLLWKQRKKNLKFETTRDRNVEFEPKIVLKFVRYVTMIKIKIISLYKKRNISEENKNCMVGSKELATIVDNISK